MAGNFNSLGKRRSSILGLSGLFAFAGCHSADREDNFGNLDTKTRQMLLAPAAGNLKAPVQQYAMTDPAMTGRTGVTPGNSFNRGPMGAQPTNTVQVDQNTTGGVSRAMPLTMGVVQASVGASTTPNNPATMQLQPRVQQAMATSPAPSNPPVMPVVVTPAAMPALSPVTTPMQPPVNVVEAAVAPAMPAQFDPPPMPTPIAVAPPAMPTGQLTALPSSPSNNLTTLPSPVEQPPSGLGPIAPPPLK